ncbi:MAG: helix-turn-helix domain-containing protein [Polyangiaceae bacterium]|nr:helix-turn-helix domain-containing protein [Polyangiaceae bacterium]
MEPSGTNSGQVFTVQEVAEYLRVTPKTVYGLVKDGSLPSFRVGRSVRCRRTDLEAFVARQAERAKPEDSNGRGRQ